MSLISYKSGLLLNFSTISQNYPLFILDSLKSISINEKPSFD